MTVTVDNTALREAVRQRMREVADSAVESMFLDMARDAPRDTGEMTNTLDVTEDDSETRIGRTLRAPVEYASWQDEGTGIYGASGGRIYPIRAKVLHFVAKDGTEVFVRSVAGTPATHWWSEKIANWGEYVAKALSG